MNKIISKNIIIAITFIICNIGLFSQSADEFSILKYVVPPGYSIGYPGSTVPDDSHGSTYYNSTRSFFNYSTTQFIPMTNGILIRNTNNKIFDSSFTFDPAWPMYSTSHVSFYLTANDSFHTIITKELDSLPVDTSGYGPRYITNSLIPASYYHIAKYGLWRPNLFNICYSQKGHKLYMFAPAQSKFMTGGPGLCIFTDTADAIIWEKSIQAPQFTWTKFLNNNEYYIQSMYINDAETTLYTYSVCMGYVKDNAYASLAPDGTLRSTTCSGSYAHIEKIDLKTSESLGVISTPMPRSSIFLCNDKRLVWIAENHYRGAGDNVNDSNAKGIYYIDLDKEFDDKNVKIDTNWQFIKSDLDKYYATHPSTDTILTRYISSLGFKNNNIFVTLRDKWIDTVKDGRINIYENNAFKWYENTIYFIDFNNLKQIGNSWDTLNLSEAFKLLQIPEKWVIENRDVVLLNYYSIDTSYRHRNGYYYDAFQPYYPVRDAFGIYKWSDNELAVALQPKDKLLVNSLLENATNIFLIYNFDTKKWRKFEFPAGIVPYYSQKQIIDWNGSKYFYITPADTTDTTFNNTLIKWTPKIGIKDTDEGIFQEIGFRKVYPNPVTYNSITADIMCYVPDISKVELGLYDLMGQRILDLTDQFDYSEATHTINITFAPPKDLPKGVYYLNVRKGTETRTKAIAIGQ